MNLDSIGGRKFLVTIICIFSTAALMWFGKITDQIYSTVILAAMGVYVAGNVTQKVKEAKPADTTTPAK